jgi:hypothetical protein
MSVGQHEFDRGSSQLRGLPVVPPTRMPSSSARRLAFQSSSITSLSGAVSCTARARTAASPAPRFQARRKSGISGLGTKCSQGVERTATVAGSFGPRRASSFKTDSGTSTTKPGSFSRSSSPSRFKKMIGEALTTRFKATLDLLAQLAVGDLKRVDLGPAQRLQKTCPVERGNFRGPGL